MSVLLISTSSNQKSTMDDPARSVSLPGPRLAQAETVGEPVADNVQAQARIVVLAMLGTRLVFPDQAQGDIHATGLCRVEGVLGLAHPQHVEAAVHDQIRAADPVDHP